MRNAKEGYFVSRVVCVNCGKEWVAVRPYGTDNRLLECPKCGHRGAIEQPETDGDSE